MAGSIGKIIDGKLEVVSFTDVEREKVFSDGSKIEIIMIPFIVYKTKAEVDKEVEDQQ